MKDLPTFWTIDDINYSDEQNIVLSLESEGKLYTATFKLTQIRRS